MIIKADYKVSKKLLSTILVFILSLCINPAFSNSIIKDRYYPEQWALNNVLLNHFDENGNRLGPCTKSPVELTSGDYECERGDPGVVDVDINAPEAWSMMSSFPVSEIIYIGVIDSGMDYSHPDLSNAFDAGLLGINVRAAGHERDNWVDMAEEANMPPNSEPGDYWFGHGTDMSAIIASGIDYDESLDIPHLATNPESDGKIAGVAPFVKLIHCAATEHRSIWKISWLNFAGFYLAYHTRDNLVECLDYFTDLKRELGINLVAVNYSAGNPRFSKLFPSIPIAIPTPYEAQFNHGDVEAALGRLYEEDILLVTVAGNFATNNESSEGLAVYPGHYDFPNIITVGAINRFGDRWSGSSYGRYSVDIYAPGEAVLSANPTQSVMDNTFVGVATDKLAGTPSVDYIVTDGTSISAAYVSGVVGLLKAQDPSRSGSKIKNLLLAGGKPIELSWTGQALSHPWRKTLTGRMLRAADFGDEGYGAMTCDNQVISARTLPKTKDLLLEVGDVIRFEVMNVNCANPAGEVILKNLTDGSQLTLKDDGLNGDYGAGDGLYSALWTVPAGYTKHRLYILKEIVLVNVVL